MWVIWLKISGRLCIRGPDRYNKHARRAWCLKEDMKGTEDCWPRLEATKNKNRKL